ncbi:MAG: thiamine pyrophosphate-dependent dehydrogenase E1 component subunit alpha [Verrucomicrobiales bacterium]|jgi:pyruvate dehydrogenase E1 component alpha subunit/2-oxoisovalerate dehydrogenase E1 component alpha subunit|nr:thiamine pyrophosphate-dependent dehydrogenase E1 component subunit alpha [Verrucomicrobiales bacterium]MEC7357418.1 thiamine pyrophosphate-dependent dehydrogenase E1 component subunit alpha [Verrucomicrobiota bacterium]
MANSANQNQEPSGKLSTIAVDTYRWMILARTFEDRISNIYRAGKIIGGVYVGKGQEAFSASLASQLVKGQDIYSPLIRDMAGRAAFGEPLIDAARTYLGSAQGPTVGRDGNVHRGNSQEGMPTMISHLGAMISVVSGMLFARRLRKQLNTVVGATCIGDGATSTGAFHEALNMAAVEKLPLIISIANNQFAYSTPTDRQFACNELVDRAAGYGVNGININGTDLIECIKGFEKAISLARAGEGPQIVVGNLLRLSGHGEHDDSPYISDELRSSDLGQDCLLKAKDKIIEESWCTEKECNEIQAQATTEVNAAIAQAESEKGPNPYSHDWNAYSSPAFRK